MFLAGIILLSGILIGVLVCLWMFYFLRRKENADERVAVDVMYVIWICTVIITLYVQYAQS